MGYFWVFFKWDLNVSLIRNICIHLSAFCPLHHCQTQFCCHHWSNHFHDSSCHSAFRLICVICLHPIRQQQPCMFPFHRQILSECIVYAHKLVLTPMLSVMVCPSLKPKSSFGPESPSWAFLLSSVSCFTHLQRSKTHKHTLSALIQK